VVDALREADCSATAACQLVGLGRSSYDAARHGYPIPADVPDPSDQELPARIRPITEAQIVVFR